MSDFTRQIDVAFRKKIDPAINRKVERAASAALTAVVLGTPVGNPDLWQGDAPPGYAGGHARRNWHVDIDRMNLREEDGIDAAGSQTIREGQVVFTRFDIARDDAVYLHNSVPYIRRLENGWSQQAPAGFVDRAVQAAVAAAR